MNMHAMGSYSYIAIIANVLDALTNETIVMVHVYVYIKAKTYLELMIAI